MTIEGTAYVFGDEVNTDIITPSDYFGEPLEVMAEHIFEPVRPGFADKVEEGDIIIAGEHFGSGSSRESAPAALQTAGVDVVVAESFARIFYRNTIAIGLPAITCSGVTTLFNDGDRAAIDLEAGNVRNLTLDTEVSAESLPAAIRDIYEQGGLIEQYQQNGQLRLTD